MSKGRKWKLNMQFAIEGLIIQVHFLKEKSNPITDALKEKLNIEKRHFNTGAYDRKAQTRMFGLIVFIFESKVGKIQTVPHVV